jgi:transcriptional regulator with XRE-family HTH domain
MRYEINYGKYVGECIRNARVLMRMSKREFASILGITHRTLARVERGHIEIPPQRLTELIFDGIMESL